MSPEFLSATCLARLSRGTEVTSPGPLAVSLRRSLDAGGHRLGGVPGCWDVSWDGICGPVHTFDTLPAVARWWTRRLRAAFFEDAWITEFASICDGGTALLLDEIRQWLVGVPLTPTPLAVSGLLAARDARHLPPVPYCRIRAEELVRSQRHVSPPTFSVALLAVLQETEGRRMHRLPLAPLQGMQTPRL